MRGPSIKLALFVLAAICALSVPPIVTRRGLRLERERHARLTADIRALGTKLVHYKSLNGQYPTSELGLRGLTTAPKDPGLNDYVYRCPGIHHRDSYDLFSAGVDRKPDTADDDWGDD